VVDRDTRCRFVIIICLPSHAVSAADLTELIFDYIWPSPALRISVDLTLEVIMGIVYTVGVDHLDASKPKNRNEKRWKQKRCRTVVERNVTGYNERFPCNQTTVWLVTELAGIIGVEPALKYRWATDLCSQKLVYVHKQWQDTGYGEDCATNCKKSAEVYHCKKNEIRTEWFSSSILIDS